jgi:hypothetical protein
MTKQKQKTTLIACLISVLVVTAFFGAMLVVGFVYELPTWFHIVNIAFFVASICFLTLVLYNTSGTFVCKTCKTQINPSFGHWITSPHIGFKKYLRCPGCDTRRWCALEAFVQE